MTLRRILVLYNTDYDAELIAASPIDVSAVREAAIAVQAAIRAAGYDSELLGVHGLDLADAFRQIRAHSPDLVFNLCESLNGDARNEALIPALLDMLHLPYTGSGPLALQLCLHKDWAKDVLRARDVATPEYVLLRDDRDLGPDLDLDYPRFLKLVHEDASIGIEASNVARSRDELVARARELFAQYGQALIAERYIAGREVNVTVIEEPAGLDVLPLHEIDFSRMPAGAPHIISYAGKWDEAHLEYGGSIPVPMRDVSAELEQAIRRISFAAFRALGLRDFARIDLRIDSPGQPWVIDVNPNCDLSPDAGVARAARAAGIEYPELLAKLCRIAWNRSHARHPPPAAR